MKSNHSTMWLHSLVLMLPRHSQLDSNIKNYQDFIVSLARSGLEPVAPRLIATGTARPTASLEHPTLPVLQSNVELCGERSTYAGPCRDITHLRACGRRASLEGNASVFKFLTYISAVWDVAYWQTGISSKITYASKANFNIQSQFDCMSLSSFIDLTIAYRLIVIDTCTWTMNSLLWRYKSCSNCYLSVVMWPSMSDSLIMFFLFSL